jgi:membrane protein
MLTGLLMVGNTQRFTMRTEPELSSPLALPRGTWTGTLKRTASEFRQDKLNHWGACADVLRGPVPVPGAARHGLAGGPVRQPGAGDEGAHRHTVPELGPATSAKTFQGPIESITANRGTAGVLFFVGVLAALWSAGGPM